MSAEIEEGPGTPTERAIAMTMAEEVSEAIGKAVAAEREACAKIAEETADELIDLHEVEGSRAARSIAEAIRERGG